MIELTKNQRNFLFSLVSILLFFSLVNVSVHQRVVVQDAELRVDTIRYVEDNCDPEQVHVFNSSFDADLDWKEVLDGE